MEEDSVDRLWLVVRSLKNSEGKYVSAFYFFLFDNIHEGYLYLIVLSRTISSVSSM